MHTELATAGNFLPNTIPMNPQKWPDTSNFVKVAKYLHQCDQIGRYFVVVLLLRDVEVGELLVNLS